MFWLLYGQLPAVAALERIQQSTAVAHAIGLTFSGDDPKVRDFSRKELTTAFPGAKPEAAVSRLIKNLAAKDDG